MADASFGTGSEAGITGRSDKKKRREEPPPPPQKNSAEIEQKIAAAEGRSKATLATDFVYEIASASVDSDEAAQAAAAVARDLSFPSLQDTLKETDPFADPVTGGPLTVKTVRRLEIGSVAQALATQFEVIQQQGVKLPSPGRPIRDPDLGTIRREVAQKIEPATLASYISAMAPLPGEMDAQTALGAAVSLAAQKVDRDRFANALRSFNDWNGETGPLEEEQVLAFAHWWAISDREEAPTRQQIIDVVYPKVGAARRLQEQKVTELEATESLVGRDARVPSIVTAEQVALEREKLELLRNDIDAAPDQWRKLVDPVIKDIFQAEKYSENSFVGKAFDGLLHGLDRVWHAIAGVGYGVFFIPARFVGAASAGDDAFEEAKRALDDAWDIVTYKDRPGNQFATDIGFRRGTTAHTIASMSAEFLAGWFIDPFVLGGRLRKALGLRRLVLAEDAATVGEPLLKGTGMFRGLAVPRTPVVERVRGLFEQPVRRSWAKAAEASGKVRFDEWWVRQAVINPDLAAELPLGLYGRGEGINRTLTGMLRTYANDVYKLTPEALRAGAKIPRQLLEDAQDLFLVSIGNKPVSALGRQFEHMVNATIPNKSRELTRQAFREGEEIALEEGERVAATARGLRVSEAERIREAGAWSWRDEVATQLEHRGLQRTIPTKPASLFRGAVHQSLRNTRIAIGESPFWRDKAMAWLRPFTEMKPNVAMNIESFEGGKMFGRWLDQFEVGGQKAVGAERVAALRSEYEAIARLGTADREARWSAFLENTVREVYTGLGLPPDVVTGIVEKAMVGYKQASRSAERAFGYRASTAKGQGPTPFTEPVLETQLLNTLVLPDPAMVKASIRDAVGSVKRFQDKSFAKFGRPIEELAEDEWRSLLTKRDWDHALTSKFTQGAQGASDAFLAVWKPSVLLRPAWPVRVIFIDENLRGLVYLQSALDRFLGIKAVARVGKKLRLQERTLVLKHGGGEIEVPLYRHAGLLPDDEAAGAVQLADAFRSASSYEGRLAKNLADVMAPIRHGSKGYYSKFAHMLNQQAGQSPLARRVAAAMLGREGWTRDKVVQWLTKDRRAQALVVGRTPEQAVERAWAYMDYYTGGRKTILRAVLNSENTVPAPAVSEELLQAVFRKRGPTLSRAAFDEAVLRNSGKMRRLVNAAFDVLARRPTNYLSRQPLFKNIFIRERERLLRLKAEQLKRTGEKLTKEAQENIQVAIDASAKEYALSEVKRVMYSLTERSRFAEASRGIVPFFAPFQEQLSVWGSLLWDNPHAIGHARLMYREAKATGVIFKDEDSGEDMIRAPAWLMSPLSGILTGGLPAKPMPDGWGISMRLEGLNLFLQSAITVPTGQIAGNVAIPTPGFSYPAQELIQEFVKHGPMPEGLRGVLSAWAFQYGPDTSVLPKPWERMVNGALGLGGQNTKMLRQTANHFLDYAAAAGMEIGEEYTLKDAKRDAGKFLVWRGLMGWILPSAPTIEWPQQEIRDQYFQRLDTQGYDEALDWLRETYPDRPDILMLAISHTTWNRDAPTIPATEAVQKLMVIPEFKEASRKHPEFTYALLPAMTEESDFDYNAYLTQIAEGLKKAKLPAERVTDLNTRQGWEAYFAIQDGFNAKIDNLDISEGDSAYETLNAERKAAIDELADGNPPWAKDYSEVVIFDEDLESRLRMTRAMLEASPLLASTDAGRGLSEYLTGRDELVATMKLHDITGLDTTGAKLLGLDKQYETLVAETKERHPRFSIFYDLWFDNDLQRVQTTDRTEYLQGQPKEAARVLSDWNREWNERRDRLFSPENDVDQARASMAVLQWAKKSYEYAEKYGVNPLEAWWTGTHTEVERDKIRLSTALRPYVFLNPFEKREILGIETSDAAEDDLLQIARRRIKLAVDVREAKKRGDPVGELYEAHEKFQEGLAAKNPDLAKELTRQQTFGFALWKVLPSTWTKGNTDAALGWRQVRGFLRELSKKFVEAGVTAFDGVYDQAKIATEDYIAEWKDYSHRFKTQWEYVDEQADGSLLDVLFPDFFFPLKVKGADSGRAA